MTSSVAYVPDFTHIKGQEHVKRALEVACAGGHSIVLSGPPGMGKTLLATATYELIAESGQRPLVTISETRIPQGTAARAHDGILLVDNPVRFSRTALTQLASVIEARGGSLNRRGQTTFYDANTMLIVTTWPCPCGWFGDPEAACTCSPALVARMRDHIAPLIALCELHVTVPRLSYEKLSSTRFAEPSQHIVNRITRAQQHQARREMIRWRANATMSPTELREYAVLDGAAQALMKAAVRQLNLSAAQYATTLMIARTIADLADRDDIGPAQLAEAIQYRPGKE
jgi:magnesium chelatase family protein